MYGEYKNKGGIYFFMRKNIKRRGFSLPEILVACAIIIALSSAAFFGFNKAQHARKMAQMQSEMEAIAAACLSYESLSSSSAPPADLATLASGLTATDSVDGCTHGNLLTWTKSNATADNFNNPWGNAYTYDADARTITTTPKDVNGTDITPVVRRF